MNKEESRLRMEIAVEKMLRGEGLIADEATLNELRSAKNVGKVASFSWEDKENLNLLIRCLKNFDGVYNQQKKFWEKVEEKWNELKKGVEQSVQELQKGDLGSTLGTDEVVALLDIEREYIGEEGHSLVSSASYEPVVNSNSQKCIGLKFWNKVLTWMKKSGRNIDCEMFRKMGGKQSVMQEIYDANASTELKHQKLIYSGGTFPFMVAVVHENAESSLVVPLSNVVMFTQRGGVVPSRVLTSFSEKRYKDFKYALSVSEESVEAFLTSEGDLGKSRTTYRVDFWVLFLAQIWSSERQSYWEKCFKYSHKKKIYGASFIDGGEAVMFSFEAEDDIEREYHKCIKVPAIGKEELHGGDIALLTLNGEIDSVDFHNFYFSTLLNPEVHYLYLFESRIGNVPEEELMKVLKSKQSFREYLAREIVFCIRNYHAVPGRESNNFPENVFRRAPYEKFVKMLYNGGKVYVAFGSPLINSETTVEQLKVKTLLCDSILYSGGGKIDGREETEKHMSQMKGKKKPVKKAFKRKKVRKKLFVSWNEFDSIRKSVFDTVLKEGIDFPEELLQDLLVRFKEKPWKMKNIPVEITVTALMKGTPVYPMKPIDDKFVQILGMVSRTTPRMFNYYLSFGRECFLRTYDQMCKDHGFDVFLTEEEELTYLRNKYREVENYLLRKTEERNEKD